MNNIEAFKDKQARKALLESCRKPTDGFISRNINRYISLWCTQYLVRTPLTANGMTILLMILGLYTGYLAADVSYWRYAFAGFLFNLNSILDGCDGELAKLKGTTSKFGQWLDTISDNTTLIAFLIGTTVGLKRDGYGELHYLAPIALSGIVLLFVVMFFYIVKVAHSGTLRAVQEDFEKGMVSDPISRFFVKLQLLIKREFYAWYFFILAVLGKPQWVLWSLALATHVAWVVILKNAWGKISVKDSR
jgi:phosphatidylglycerophosphate synthase